MYNVKTSANKKDLKYIKVALFSPVKLFLMYVTSILRSLGKVMLIFLIMYHMLFHFTVFFGCVGGINKLKYFACGICVILMVK